MIGKNNPYNVRYNHLNRWQGLEGQTRGFCDFSSLYYGIRACFYLISKSYKKKGFVTYSQIINRYAPPSENFTQDYVDFVCHRCGVLPFDVPSSDTDWLNLLYAMSIYEGNVVSKDELQMFLNLYKIHR